VAKKIPAGASLCTTAVGVGVGAWTLSGFAGEGDFEQEYRATQEKITADRAVRILLLPKNLLYISRKRDG